MTRAIYLVAGSLLLVACALAVVTAKVPGKDGAGSAETPELRRPQRTVRSADQPAWADSPGWWDSVGELVPGLRAPRSNATQQPVPGGGAVDAQQPNVGVPVARPVARPTLPMVGVAHEVRAELAAGTSMAPVGTNPSERAAAVGSGCAGEEFHIQPQGVSADVDFVGVLLNGDQREGRSFSSAELGDLKILVQWRNLFQNHRQRIDLIAPDGALYQSLARPLTVMDGSAPVEMVLPVNGTWITRYGLYGTWCVKVFFDQDDAPVTSGRLVISAR